MKYVNICSYLQMCVYVCASAYARMTLSGCVYIELVTHSYYKHTHIFNHTGVCALVRLLMPVRRRVAVVRPLDLPSEDDLAKGGIPSHVPYIKESCHTHERVISHM